MQNRLQIVLKYCSLKTKKNNPKKYKQAQKLKAKIIKKSDKKISKNKGIKKWNIQKKNK